MATFPAIFRFLIVAVVALTLAAAMASSARAADGAFEIRSAYVEPVDGIYLLNAQLRFELPDGARQAVRDGVVFTFDVDLTLHRTRRFWFDANVASLSQHYQIGFHALSERFVLRNLNSGETQSFATLDGALEALTSIRNLPVLDTSLIEPNEEYEFNMRATLDVRTLPEALKWVLFWKDDWRQRTVWYTWSLVR